MKFRGVGIGQLTSALRPTPNAKSPSDLSASKAKYSKQVGKLGSIFSRKEENPRMGKHKSKSPKSPKAKAAKSLKKVKNFVSEQKAKVKQFKSKGRPIPSDSESLVGGGSEGEEGTRPKSGLRFHMIAALIGLIFIAAAAGFIFIPIVNAIAVKYLWIAFGGSSVPLVLSFLGMGASTATLLNLYVLMFKWTEVRKKTLEDWTLVICYAVSALIAGISLLICALHFHDIVEIFGEEFLELLQGYWMTPKFKTGMDQIQIEFQCCGFYSYEDWAAVGNMGEYPPGFVPFSCCSVFTLRPCVHANVPKVRDLDSSGNIPLEQQLSIYPKGCKLPMENYYKGMLHWAIIISSALLATQVILILLLTCSRKPSNVE